MAVHASQSCSPVFSLLCERDTVRVGHDRNSLRLVGQEVADWFPLTNRGHWAHPFLQLALAFVLVILVVVSAVHTFSTEPHLG